MITRRHLFKLLVVVAVVVAAVIVYRSLGRYTWEEVRISVAAIPLSNLLSAFGFVIASYVCLSGFDWLAVRYAGIVYRPVLRP